jgi:hypothetical protein
MLKLNVRAKSKPEEVVKKALEFSISESLTPFIRQAKSICVLKD